MEKLNEYLQTLISVSGTELHLEPNKNPYVLTSKGTSEIDSSPMQGTQISMMVFPLIPNDVKSQLPSSNEIEFVHPHNLGHFSFNVQKSPAGFVVTVRPIAGKAPIASAERAADDAEEAPKKGFMENLFSKKDTTPAAPETVEAIADEISAIVKPEQAVPPSGDLSSALADLNLDDYELPTVSKPQEPVLSADPEPTVQADSFNTPSRSELQPNANFQPATVSGSISGTTRMDDLFKAMAAAGASDLHMSVSMPPMIRKDGRMKNLECSEGVLDSSEMKKLLESIMPKKNQEEFAERNDTDFAYEITGLARFRCNIFADRKGMGGVFRIIPSKILTAEDLKLSKAIMDLTTLSKGLVVVTGPTGSGKSTTLCAMVDSINKTREDHIITIEDPIEFVHENHKCLVNQREVHNHTSSFKDALRAALREDPDIVLVGEMRDLETISIAIETAETGHLVFGTLHTTTAASTVDRIIDQFPADRQQQIRVMLSESLKGVIAQTLLPKKGGGRVAALEVLIVTPAISNLIREGKTFQIASSMQTGKTQGMVLLNDALFDLVKRGLVEPRDAYIKAVDKANFELMLSRGGFDL